MAGRHLTSSVFAVALAALIATPASASDQACTRDTIGAKAVAVKPATLEAVIAAAFAPEADATTGEAHAHDASTPHMLVARIKDGKVVMACVDTKEAATRFLAAPAAKLRSKAAEAK
jgi:hypothetical protein